ncbi:secreted antigen 1 [Babesia divergens]|uniref:Secreted antigen 1 n=1 Tax=Babesia divergens TaxID=32595 RepID=A0AAD9LDD5_BABDI|nr:secreted antigen 1 [Babesia divergens]
MAEQQPCNFEDPGTLKDILELLAKLSESRTLKNSVGQKLLEDVQKYCKDAEKFYGSHSGLLMTVLQYAGNIRSSILKNSQSSETYDKYKDLETEHGSHERCVAEALKECLPRGYAALYYLYFMCSNDCKSMHGGAWNNNNVKDSGQKLYKWLTDDRTVTMPELIDRGFSQGKLKESNDGDTVATLIAKIIKHDSAGPLQSALSYLLFVCPWEEFLLGHALCFLNTFCSKVSAEEGLQEKLKGYSGDLKTVCQDLQNHLQHFIVGTSKLYAVCQKNTKLFDGIWDDKNFDKYCDWLKGNLHYIIGSLVSMSQEPPGWDLSTIQSASSAGPFKYGFVFRTSWDASTSESKLQGYISKLTGSDSGSLGKLKSFLENPSTPSSAGATAGGVFTGLLGTGGLGAGAAYATNAFGLKDIITGFISSFLK